MVSPPWPWRKFDYRHRAAGFIKGIGEEARLVDPYISKF